MVNSKVEFMLVKSGCKYADGVEKGGGWSSSM
jgi:hypothetical protein